MSTSLVYHAFGVRGYRQVKESYPKKSIAFHLEHGSGLLRCPACDSEQVVRRGGVVRTFRTLPVGKKAVTLVISIPRVACKACGCIRQVHLDFAPPRRSYTNSFARYVIELCQCMTMSDVAHHLGVGWDLVKEIEKEHLERHYARPKLAGLRLIGIDEIAVAKGHRYLTVVLDMQTGAVVFVGDGKDAEALEPFWRRLRSSGARIEAVAMDMSPAYRQAVAEHLPQSAIVYDHFHVVKLLNDELSKLRRELQRDAAKEHKDVLKGIRWLLLKNPDTLDDRHNERERLDEALRINRPLATAYYLKEDLRQFWKQPDKSTAAPFLDDWIARARAADIPTLNTFATTLETHREGILAWYDHPISNGPLEGTNNKIKTMQRQAYGFRDREFFKLRIYAIHEAKYALTG